MKSILTVDCAHPLALEGSRRAQGQGPLASVSDAAGECWTRGYLLALVPTLCLKCRFTNLASLCGTVHPFCDPQHEATLNSAFTFLRSGIGFMNNLLRPKRTLTIILELIELYGFPLSLKPFKLHFQFFYWLILN